MRPSGLYDTTRGLTLAVAAGVAGLLLWAATQVGTQSVGRFWAAMAIVAGAGAVVAFAQLVGSWTSGLRLRLSPGSFALAFLPVLVCVGWILLASQPGDGFAEGHVQSWSRSIGLFGLIHALALWHGVLAFGFGLVFGFCFDAVPDVVLDTVPGEEPRPDGAMSPPADEPLPDEPLPAERGAVVEEPPVR